MSAVLVVRCDEFLVGVPAPLVREVLAGPELGEPDARCAGWRGSLAWRGRRIPLVDLRERMAEATPDPPLRAVVTEFREAATFVAFAVDDVMGLDEADVAGAQAPLPGLAPIAGTGSGDSFLSLLDYRAMFTPDERAALQAACAADEGTPA
jgi:chemotaxis signal transduction protein